MADLGTVRDSLDLQEFRSHFAINQTSLKWELSGGTATHSKDSWERKNVFVCETEDDHILVYPILKSVQENAIQENVSKKGLISKVIGVAKDKLEQLCSEGFEALKVPIYKCRFSLGAEGEMSSLRIDFQSSELAAVSIPLGDQNVDSKGDWSYRWQAQIRGRLGLVGGSFLCSGRFQGWEVLENGFGKNELWENIPVAIGVERGIPRFFPGPMDLPWKPVAIHRNNVGNKTSISLLVDNGEKVFIVFLRANGCDQFCALEPVFSSIKPAEFSDLETSFNLGIFRSRMNNGSSKPVVLLKRASGVTLINEGGKDTHFEFGFPGQGGFVLVSSSTNALMVECEYETQAMFGETVREYRVRDDEPGTDNGFASVFLSESSGLPISVEITAHKVSFGGSVALLFSDDFSFNPEPIDEDMYKVSFSGTSVPNRSMQILGPRDNILAFSRYLERRRVLFDSVNREPSYLYGQLIEARKYTFLNSVFGDIVLINRALNEGSSMSELVEKVQTAGEAKFKEDPELKKETVEKLTILTITMPRLRQKLEILRLSYPHTWASLDSEWLTEFFGDRAIGISERERDAAIQRLRIAITRSQGEMQRSLSNIDSALRPLSHLIAREKFQSHWLRRVQKFAPLIAQAGGLAAAAAAGPLGPVTYMVVAGLGGGAVAALAGAVLNDKETELTFRLAAEEVLPWWQIFIQSFGVSAAEMARFVEKDSQRAMIRDRKLFDSLPSEEKSRLAQRLPDLLSKQLAKESSFRYMPVPGVDETLVGQIGEDMEEILAQNSVTCPFDLASHRISNQ